MLLCYIGEKTCSSSIISKATEDYVRKDFRKGLNLQNIIINNKYKYIPVIVMNTSGKRLLCF